METAGKEHGAKDGYKFSRLMGIIESAFEYFISLLLVGAYLAKVTDAIGLSDGMTGILTAFVSLGCGFQIFALFFSAGGAVKKWVTVFHTVNQLCFAFIYAVPLIPAAKAVKATVFIVILLLGHIINNVIHSPKMNWFMSLVDNEKRGVFTSNKEIASLMGGMIFSFAMGALISHFEEIGRLNTAFLAEAVSIFVLTLLHSLTLILSKEKPAEACGRADIRESLKALFKNKTVFKVLLVAVFWNIANYASMPFYGSYQIKELGFSMTFVSVLGIVYAFVRSVLSRALGKYADKKSFVNMLNICYIIACAGFLVNIFTVPSNGKIFYTVYYILYAAAMAGINSGTVNLIYDKIDAGQRVGAYALQQSIAGVAGFITAAAVSLLVGRIQRDGNMIFGIGIYAQQVVSLISAVVTVWILIYINIIIKKDIKPLTRDR
jgi:Na+/melibiose symporter-like transporter